MHLFVDKFQNDWGNLIVFLGIQGVYDDYKQQKREKSNWLRQVPQFALASVCRLLATTLEMIVWGSSYFYDRPQKSGPINGVNRAREGAL